MSEKNFEPSQNDDIEKQMLNAELIMEKQKFERDRQKKWDQIVEIQAQLQILDIWEEEGRILSSENRDYLKEKPKEAEELLMSLEEMREGTLSFDQRLKLNKDVADRVSEIMHQKGH